MAGAATIYLRFDHDGSRLFVFFLPLLGFPDGFRFAGTMNPAFRQIGNAVPPLLARAVAMTLRRQLIGDTADTRTDSEARAEQPRAVGAGR